MTVVTTGLLERHNQGHYQAHRRYRTDNAAVVNRAPYFNRNEGDGLLTERTVDENTPKDMNIGDVLGATDDDAGDDLTFAFDPVH